MPSSTSSFKAFLLAFAATVTALSLCFVVATEWIITTKVIPAHNFTRYLALFQSSTASDAIFGDSIPANGVTGLPGFINLALGGDNFAGMAAKIRLYFKDRTPDKVIIQAGLHHLSRQYIHHRDDGEGFAALLGEHGEPLLKLLDPLYRYEIATYWRTVAEGGTFVPRERFQPDGSRLSPVNYAHYPQFLRHSAAGQVAQLTLPMPDPMHNPAITGTRSLIAMLQAKGGHPCLVTFPVTRDVHEATAALPEFQGARRAFATLAAETGIRYVDLYDLSLPDSLFADFTHLNQDGARLMSPQIAAACFG